MPIFIATQLAKVNQLPFTDSVPWRICPRKVWKIWPGKKTPILLGVKDVLYTGNHKNLNFSCHQILIFVDAKNGQRNTKNHRSFAPLKLANCFRKTLTCMGRGDKKHNETRDFHGWPRSWIATMYTLWIGLWLLNRNWWIYGCKASFKHSQIILYSSYFLLVKKAEGWNLGNCW